MDDLWSRVPQKKASGYSIIGAGYWQAWCPSCQLALCFQLLGGIQCQITSQNLTELYFQMSWATADSVLQDSITVLSLRKGLSYRIDFVVSGLSVHKKSNLGVTGTDVIVVSIYTLQWWSYVHAVCSAVTSSSILRVVSSLARSANLPEGLYILLALIF